MKLKKAEDELKQQEQEIADQQQLHQLTLKELDLIKSAHQITQQECQQLRSKVRGGEGGEVRGGEGEGRGEVCGGEGEGRGEGRGRYVGGEELHAHDRRCDVDRCAYWRYSVLLVDEHILVIGGVGAYMWCAYTFVGWLHALVVFLNQVCLHD